MDFQRNAVILYFDSHCPEGVQSRNIVLAAKESGDRRNPPGNRAEDDGAMGNGLISRDGNLPLDSFCRMYSVTLQGKLLIFK